MCFVFAARNKYFKKENFWLKDLSQGCRSLLSIGWDNLQFYPNFSLFSTLRGMNLDHNFFQVYKLSEGQKKVFTKIGRVFFPNSSEDQKKRSSPKLEKFFSPTWSVADRLQVIQIQTRVKLLGGMQSNYWGDISPHPLPPRFRHACLKHGTVYLIVTINWLTSAFSILLFQCMHKVLLIGCKCLH